MVAWIALALGTFASIVSASQLVRLIRFRKPIFEVDRAKFKTETRGGMLFFGPGTVELEIRGGLHPVTITKWEMTSPQGGVGMSSLTLYIQPEVWSRVVLPFEVGLGVPSGNLPERIRFELFLSNPRDLFIVPFELQLVGEAYQLDDRAATLRHIRRTTWRHSPTSWWRRAWNLCVNLVPWRWGK